jgi:hypothetical protein
LATHSLDITFEEHFDFDLFSISCLESIYRVVYEINQTLNIDLQIVDLLEYEHKDKIDFYFPLYSFTDETINIELNLLPNKTSFQPSTKHPPTTALDLFSDEVEKTIVLIPELENSNYFFLIKGHNRHLYNHHLLQSVQSISLFTAVTEIYLDDLKNKKSKSNLLF